MTVFDKPRYTNLTDEQKRIYIKRAKKKLAKKLEPLLVMRRLYIAYKNRIDLEEGKLN